MWNPAPTSTDFIDAARETARWIRAAERSAIHGSEWLPDPEQPDRRATVSAPQTVYSGSAGIVLFFLELAAATGDVTYLGDAERGANQIAATWREVLDFPFLIPLEHVNLDFNHGLAGTSFTLLQAGRILRNPDLVRAGEEIAWHILNAAHPTASGIAWTGASSAALGDGAIVLFLLWVANELDNPAFRDGAVRAGEHILQTARPDHRGGLRWDGFPLETIGAPQGADMPNFEFGTAGVAFVMARLFAEIGDQRFLDAAAAGADHIAALATVRDDAALLFHRSPDLTDLFYLGYCGGPVGTARVFYELYRLTGDARRRTWLERFARGISESGAPEQQTPGLWNVTCQCCGTAGIVDFFTSLWAALDESAFLAYAQRTGEHLLSHATRFDGAGCRWHQAWTRTQPGVVAAETGYMIGAAGVGSALLHLGLAMENRYQAILFPDNPFPRQRITPAAEFQPGKASWSARQ